MANTYSWRFGTFSVLREVGELTNVIVQIPFTLTASNGQGSSASISGSVELSTPRGQDFIPYDQLTEEDTLQILGSLINVNHYKKAVDHQLVLATQRTPSVVRMKPPFSS